MGVLKDALHLAVWQHLKVQSRCQTFVTALNAPTTGPSSIRQAWASLKENGRSEGMKKATGLQAVLLERGDLFYVHTNDRGHILIALTPDAQARDIGAGLPAFDRKNVYVPNDNVSSDASAVAATIQAAKLDEADLGSLLKLGSSEGQDPAFATQFVEALKAAEGNDGSGNGVKLVRSISGKKFEPVAKKQKVGTSYSVAGDRSSKVVTRGKNGLFQDIIWTPQIAAQEALERQKDAALARALFNVVDINGGQPVKVSQLGSDFHVAQLKKDAQFKNHKLLDILRYHEDVFELVADSSSTGGFMVKLQPGAEAALPDADTFHNEVQESDLLLPERIEEPRTHQEKMQALRIELILTLHRRGGKVALQELGMDPKVAKIRSGLQKSQKLIDVIKMFPENFKVSSGDDALMVVEIASVDVFDQSAIVNSLNRIQGQTQQSGHNKWKPRQEPRVVPRFNQAESVSVSSSNRGYVSGDLGYGHLGTPKAPPATFTQHSVVNPYVGIPPHPHAYGAPPPPHGFSHHQPPPLHPPPPTFYPGRLV